MLAGMAVPPSIADAPERERYEIALDHEVVGFLAYHRTPQALALVHTEIEDGHEGEGLGSELIRAVLDRARAQRTAVLPFCPFVRGFIERHEEYLDLVPVERRAEFRLD
jgi:predicted GNAT family acetyltransferase